MFVDQLHNCVQLHAAESSSALQRNRLEPELRNHVFTSDMDVRRLAAIQGYEEKTMGTYLEDGRHFMTILFYQPGLPREGENFVAMPPAMSDAELTRVP